MSATILEYLQNANYNLREGGGIGAFIAKGQLHPAIVLLNKGYDLQTEVEPLLIEYGTVEDVPVFRKNDFDDDIKLDW